MIRIERQRINGLLKYEPGNIIAFVHKYNSTFYKKRRNLNMLGQFYKYTNGNVTVFPFKNRNLDCYPAVTVPTWATEYVCYDKSAIPTRVLNTYFPNG